MPTAPFIRLTAGAGQDPHQATLLAILELPDDEHYVLTSQETDLDDSGEVRDFSVHWDRIAGLLNVPLVGADELEDLATEIDEEVENA